MKLLQKIYFLCFCQCLAHVEAFIDFSEDELIEDGVLDRGVFTFICAKKYNNRVLNRTEHVCRLCFFLFLEKKIANNCFRLGQPALLGQTTRGSSEDRVFRKCEKSINLAFKNNLRNIVSTAPKRPKHSLSAQFSQTPPVCLCLSSRGICILLSGLIRSL